MTFNHNFKSQIGSEIIQADIGQPLSSQPLIFFVCAAALVVPFFVILACLFLRLPKFLPRSIWLNVESMLSAPCHMRYTRFQFHWGGWVVDLWLPPFAFTDSTQTHIHQGLMDIPMFVVATVYVFACVWFTANDAFISQFTKIRFHLQIFPRCFTVSLWHLLIFAKWQMRFESVTQHVKPLLVAVKQHAWNVGFAEFANENRTEFMELCRTDLILGGVGGESLSHTPSRIEITKKHCNVKPSRSTQPLISIPINELSAWKRMPLASFC